MFQVRLIPDEYHLTDVGRLDNGASYWIDRQLYLENGTTRDFVACYVFDNEGRLIWHQIEDLGLRSDLAQKAPSEVVAEHLSKLGTAESTEIFVYPFNVEAHGLTFGLVIRETEEGGLDDISPIVDALPGWTLMFYPPWEEGQYDT